jgi:hypothetical protein
VEGDQRTYDTHPGDISIILGGGPEGRELLRVQQRDAIWTCVIACFRLAHWQCNAIPRLPAATGTPVPVRTSNMRATLAGVPAPVVSPMDTCWRGYGRQARRQAVTVLN